MSSLSTPRTVVIVKEQSNWSTQDRWGSYWLLVASAIGMLLGVAAALLWAILGAAGAATHGIYIAIITFIAGTGCIILALKFPYIASRQPHWYWPIIGIAAAAWVSTNFSAARYVSDWATPAESLRSMPARKIERLVDDLYAKHHLLRYAYGCGRPFNPFYCAWYRLALEPAEIAYDDELNRRRYEPANTSSAETLWEGVWRRWVAYTSVPILSLMALALCAVTEAWKAQMSEPGTGPDPEVSVKTEAPPASSVLGGDDSSLAALNSWQKECVSWNRGKSEDVKVLYRHYASYASWISAKPFGNANAFSQAWSSELGKRGIVRSKDDDRKFVGLELRRDGISKQILDRMEEEDKNGGFGQTVAPA